MNTSEKVLFLSAIVSGIGIIVPLGHVIPIISTVSSVIGWYKSKQLRESKSIAENVEKLKITNNELEELVDDLRFENKNLLELEKDLKEIVDGLKSENKNLLELEKTMKSDINDLRVILNITDTQNKTSEEIQKELISIVKELKIQNDRHVRLNRAHAFLIADKNNDGKVSGSELNILKNIAFNSSKEMEEFDKNKDNVITRDEFLNN